MSRPFEILHADGTVRRVADDEFPLAIGGADGDVEIAGTSGSKPLAWIGLDDGRVFVQALPDRPRIVCNGAPLESSQWIHAGDELSAGATRISVEAAGPGLRWVVGSAVEEVSTEPPERPVAVTVPDATTTLEPVEFSPRPLAGTTSKRRRFRPLAVLPWLGLALLGLAGWMLFSLRTVELEVQPSPELLRVNGPWPVIELGERHVLRPGDYTLIAEKSGYRRLERSFEIDSETARKLEFVMEKQPGLLVVDVGNVVGAEVLIDGESRGTTPLEGFELAAGEYELRVRAERREEFVTTVAIVGEGRTQTVTVELPGRWATIGFHSEPAGAAVVVDGKHVGVTPFSGDLMQGRHRYELALDGYKTHRDTVAVVAGRTTQLPRVALEWADATLRLSSNPDGASVSVDGRFRGDTPVDVTLAPNEPHRVEISRGGYEPQVREIELEPGDRSELTVTLDARVGEITISASPSAAELRIDGVGVGNANRVVELPAVPHELELSLEGYESYRTSVTPRPGFPQRIEVTLKTAEQIERESTPPTIRTAVGQEMVLVRGGRMRMGASRREPGRRSNETLREVELVRPFYISTLEVTNAEYRQFDAAHLSGRAGRHNLEIDHHPVVRVSWDNAARYCNWLSAKDGLTPVYERDGDGLLAARPLADGYRLPTEAEWAWVARRSSGENPIKYPWGDTLPVAADSGNYADASAEELLSNTISDYSDGFPATAPVDSFEPNALGIRNLGGNVAEWMHDRYTIYPSNLVVPEVDPGGPDQGELHVIRGSSWMDSTITELRLTYRDYGRDPRPDLGFRIARYAK